MSKFYVSVNYSAVIEADDDQSIYDAFPTLIHLDSGLGSMDYEFAEVDEA